MKETTVAEIRRDAKALQAKIYELPETEAMEKSIMLIKALIAELEDE